VRADELKLRDGTKISGTIVGFEENSFKVKTSYGYAVVQKDQVVSISMSDAPKAAAASDRIATKLARIGEWTIDDGRLTIAEVAGTQLLRPKKGGVLNLCWPSV